MGFADFFKKKENTKRDYATEFKAAYEEVSIEKCLNIGREWEQNDKDANYYFGTAMLFYGNNNISLDVLVDLYKAGLNTPHVTNTQLADWYKQSATVLLEMRANENGLTLNQALGIDAAPANNVNATENDDEDLPAEIDFTVHNNSTGQHYTFNLKKNQYGEYIADIDSTTNIFDYCFGGDIITVTYSVFDDGDYKDVPVDYNIMDDDYVENIMKNDPRFKPQYDLTVKIEGTKFYKSVTSSTIDRIDFTGVEADFNEIKKQMLTHLFDLDNSLLVDISVGDELKADIKNVANPFTPFQEKYGEFDLKVKKIEFVSRLSKPDGRKNIPMFSNINVFKD